MQRCVVSTPLFFTTPYLNSDTRAVLEMHVHAMMQDKIATCAPGMDRSFGDHILQKETERVNSVTYVHRCQKLKMERIEFSYRVVLCRISKSVLPRRFTMMIKRSVVGESARGSNLWPRRMVPLEMCADRCARCNGRSCLDRINWPLTSRDVFFLEMHANVGSGRELVWKQFQTVQAPGGWVRLSWQVCGAAHTLRASC